MKLLKMKCLASVVMKSPPEREGNDGSPAATVSRKNKWLSAKVVKDAKRRETIASISSGALGSASIALLARAFC